MIIPTHNRAGILAKCLTALEAQACAEPFEAIVVDDGSTDRTPEMLAEWNSRRYTLISIRQENKKPAAARNLGMQHAAGEFILFLGDDIIASPQLLGEHARSRSLGDGEIAVLGYTVWSPELRVTRFMKYLGEQGWQFGYSLIQDPNDVPFNFFYTSNISLPRSLLERVGEFDESFGTAGWEDIEYGYRLKHQGAKIVFRREARAEHLHCTTFRSFCARQYCVGRFAPYFYKKHPELKEFLGGDTPRPALSRRIALNFLTRLCFLEEYFPRLDFSRFYPDLMTYHYLRGLWSATRENPT
ncbi:MAG TPA: glycosyltransferase family A protein [Acidobacteriota bacterium]|nr:glycosyltransferase family A protein [Acidobacteriota bacterium]